MPVFTYSVLKETTVHLSQNSQKVSVLLFDYNIGIISS